MEEADFEKRWETMATEYLEEMDCLADKKMENEIPEVITSVMEKFNCSRKEAKRAIYVKVSTGENPIDFQELKYKAKKKLDEAKDIDVNSMWLKQYKDKYRIIGNGTIEDRYVLEEIICVVGKAIDEKKGYKK
jgi:hypothetical protein